MPKISSVVLEYLFMFDPEETWNNLYAFEADLVKFFNAHGSEAIVIKPVDGQQGKRVLLIQRKEELKPLSSSNTSVSMPVSEKEK